MAGQSNKRAIRNLKNEKFFAGLVDFPRAPTGTDIKNRKTGERFEIPTFARDTATGDLWYLAAYAAGVADWRKLADAEGAVTTLLDQVNVEVDPNTSGQIAVDGLTVANAANPSGIPLETVAGTNTLVAQVQVGAAITGAPADKNDAGLISANDTQFAIDANGNLTLVGGADLPGIQTVTSDDPTIVGPDASGNIDLTGEAVANATNAKPVFVDAGTNALNIEVQVGAAVTGAPGDKNDAGLSSYNDTQFAQDADGWVSMVGGTDLPGIQTLTGDSGGAQGPDANGDVSVVGGAGVSVVGTTNTLTISASEAEVAKVGVSNLGISLSSGVFSITSADGSALSASNKGFVTLPSVATPGTLLTISVEDDHQFIDDVGTSTVAGMLWGASNNLDWADDIPFFIYAIMNDADDEVAFGITRSPAMGASYATANIGASGTIVTTGPNTLFLMDLETGPTTPTIAEYDTNPSLLVGSFRMTKTSTTSNDWTVSALADSDGIGRFQLGTQWTFPTGQNGSTSGTYFQSTTSTQPTFSDGRSTYHLLKNGIVKYVLEQNTAVAGVGAGLLEPTLPVACLANSGADAYTNCRHSLAATTVRNVYTGTINGAALFCTSLYKANSTTTLTNAIIATSDEFTFHAIYPGFN